ncbi:MAG: hypothetical protein ACQESB_05230 [Elusimicrobiota bacterium]
MNILKRVFILIAFILLLRTGAYSYEEAAFEGKKEFRDVVIEFEYGPLYIFQNDGRYGSRGTKYSASDMGQQRNLYLSRRVSAEIALNRRNRLILLYAPFDVQTNVKLDRDINFRNTVFQEGSLVSHRYLFDGYRASYLNRIISGKQLDLDIGGSIQIRNAEVSFTDVESEKYESENDIGIVFAFKSRVVYKPSEKNMWFMLEGDGFSTFGLLGDSVRGAIYDLKIGAGTALSSCTDMIIGTRLLGGGAEVKNKNIDNWGNYGSLSLSLRFKFPE